MMALAPSRLGHNACTCCDVLSVFCFKAVCKMLVLTGYSSFPNPGWVGGAQGGEPKDNPSPTERRDRSLKAQGPTPLPQPSPDGTGAPPTPGSPGRGAKGPTQPGETRPFLTLDHMDCFLGEPSRAAEEIVALEETVAHAPSSY